MSNKALAGLRVIEFGPYVARPLTGRILGSLGAEIIKVGTNKVLDEMAFIPAWSRAALDISTVLRLATGNIRLVVRPGHNPASPNHGVCPRI